MKLKPRYLPFIALCLGIPGLLLRYWLFATGIDSKGLLVITHPANAAIYILAGIGLALIGLAVFGHKSSVSSKELFQPSIIACIGSFLAAAGLMYTSVQEYIQASAGITQFLCLLGVPAALCLAAAGILRLKRHFQYLLHAVMAAYLILHILSQYRVWNIEPQLQNYFPQLLAAVFLMISAYYRATLDAGTAKARNFLFFNYGALLFCVLSIKGDDPIFYSSMAVWTATAACSLRPAEPAPAPMELPEDVLYCMRTLNDAGYTAYVVGGCVRDHLLGLVPHDYDLCTSAKPEEICDLFSQHDLVRAGEKHGTIGVVLDGNVYEITTYRTEDNYSDNRHPDQVTFVTAIKDDLARRDFTVNAIAYSPETGFIDPFDGQKDLRDRVLRAVGDPETRFHEDALRILRGVRFAVRFRFEPEEGTMLAMLRCVDLTENLARERVFAELCGILPHVTAEDLVLYCPILTKIIPELVPTVGFRQNNPHHTHDVYNHTALTVEAILPEVALRMAALLHDIGKPETYSEDEDGVGHFYGHEKRSAEIASQVLHRLKASNAFREQVVSLIENHMVLFEADKKQLRRRIRKYGMNTVEQMLTLQKADMTATGTRTEEDLASFDQIHALLEEIRSEDSCFTIKDLAINGSDLIALGFQPGPGIGQCLEKLLDAVVEETLVNERESLLIAAKELL